MKIETKFNIGDKVVVISDTANPYGATLWRVLKTIEIFKIVIYSENEICYESLCNDDYAYTEDCCFLKIEDAMNECEKRNALYIISKYGEN